MRIRDDKGVTKKVIMSTQLILWVNLNRFFFFFFYLCDSLRGPSRMLENWPAELDPPNIWSVIKKLDVLYTQPDRLHTHSSISNFRVLLSSSPFLLYTLLEILFLLHDECLRLSRPTKLDPLNIWSVIWMFNIHIQTNYIHTL